MTQTAVFLLFDASPPSKPQCQMVWPTHLCTYNFSPNERRPHFPARHNGSLVHPIASKSFSSHRVRIAYFCKPSHPRANNDSCRTWNDILTICPAPFAIPHTVQGSTKNPDSLLLSGLLYTCHRSCQKGRSSLESPAEKSTGAASETGGKGTGPAGDSAGAVARSTFQARILLYLR